MKPRCSVEGCPELCEHANTYDYGYICPTHGFHPAEELHAWNDVDAQVWLRSREVSYSSVQPRGMLLLDGTVRARGLEGFTWEQWPEKPQGNRSR